MRSTSGKPSRRSSPSTSRAHFLTTPGPPTSPSVSRGTSTTSVDSRNACPHPSLPPYVDSRKACPHPSLPPYVDSRKACPHPSLPPYVDSRKACPHPGPLPRQTAGEGDSLKR